MGAKTGDCEEEPQGLHIQMQLTQFEGFTKTQLYLVPGAISVHTLSQDSAGAKPSWTRTILDGTRRCIRRSLVPVDLMCWQKLKNVIPVLRTTGPWHMTSRDSTHVQVVYSTAMRLSQEQVEWCGNCAMQKLLEPAGQ